MSLQSKLRVFAGGFDALNRDVCELNAKLRKEPKCEGKYDIVTLDQIKNADAYCLKGLCLEQSTIDRFLRTPAYASGSTPLRGYVTNEEWRAALEDLGVEVAEEQMFSPIAPANDDMEFFFQNEYDGPAPSAPPSIAPQ